MTRKILAILYSTSFYGPIRIFVKKEKMYYEKRFNFFVQFYGKENAQ